MSNFNLEVGAAIFNAYGKSRIGEIRNVAARTHQRSQKNGSWSALNANYSHYPNTISVEFENVNFLTKFTFSKVVFFHSGKNDSRQFNWVITQQEMCYAETEVGTPYERWCDILEVETIYVGLSYKVVGNLKKYKIESVSTVAPKRSGEYAFKAAVIAKFGDFFAHDLSPISDKLYIENGDCLDRQPLKILDNGTIETLNWGIAAVSVELKKQLLKWGITPPNVVEEWGDSYFIFEGKKIQITNVSEFFGFNAKANKTWLNRALIAKSSSYTFFGGGKQMGVSLFVDGKIVEVFDNTFTY